MVHTYKGLRTDSTNNFFKQLEKRFMTLLGVNLFGIDEETLPGKTGQLLKKHNLTLGIAESCTGGLITSYITDISGSSEYLMGGVIAYTNEIKEKLLGVNKKTLEKFGVVSSEVAEEMASGVRHILKADFGLATTGYAGPSGGTCRDPVGTVYIALATPKEILSVKKFYPQLKRTEVKKYAAKEAIDILRRYIIKEFGDV